MIDRRLSVCVFVNYAHLPEKHPVEVGREVDVVSQRKPSDVAPQVRVGLVRNLRAQQQEQQQWWCACVCSRAHMAAFENGQSLYHVETAIGTAQQL